MKAAIEPIDGHHFRFDIGIGRRRFGRGLIFGGKIGMALAVKNGGAIIAREEHGAGDDVGAAGVEHFHGRARAFFDERAIVEGPVGKFAGVDGALDCIGLAIHLDKSAFAGDELDDGFAGSDAVGTIAQDGSDGKRAGPGDFQRLVGKVGGRFCGGGFGCRWIGSGGELAGGGFGAGFIG